MSTLLRTVLIAPPTSPTATPISPSQINLAWTAVLNASSYRVYRNGVLVDSTGGLTSSSTGLTQATLYTFQVAAVAADGQEGPKGSQFTATTLTQSDTIAPTIPGSVAATALSTTTIRITWAASTDTGGSGLAGYRVYRSTTLAGTYTQLGSDTTALSFDDFSLTASTTMFYKVLAFDGNSNTSALSVAASATTQTGSTQTGIRFHPGHYGQLRTVAGVKTSEAVILADLAVIQANAAESRIIGWAANFAWKQIETAPGVFDFTIPDRYFNACKAAGKRFIFRLDYRRYSGDGTQSVVPADMYPAGQVAAADGGATPRDWEAAVMTRIIAAWLAVAGHYDADPMFEGGQGMVETSVSFDTTFPAPSNYTTANKKTQYKRWMDAMRGPGGFQYAQVWFGQNYLGNSDGSDCEEMIQYAIARNIGVGGPDTWQFDWVVPPNQSGKRPLWSDEVARGVRGSGTDYRLQRLAWPREAQGTEMGGYIGNMLPQNILQSANYDGSQWMIWDYNTAGNNPGSTPATQWGNGSTQGILWVIRNQSVTNTVDPYAEVFDYYIGPLGNNSNAGTATSPWALSALASKGSTFGGKRVGLLDGNYVFSGSGQILLDIINATGTASSPTTIKAVNARQAVITTNNGGVYPSFAPGCPALLGVNSNWVVIDGLKITDLSGHGIALQTASNIVIRNCEISNIRTSRNSGQADTNCGGVYFLTQSIVKNTILIENCLFKDIYNGPATVLRNTSNGVGDLFGARNVTVRNCTFVNMGTPMYWKGQSGNTLFENNFCFNVGEGLQSFSTTGIGNPSSNIARGNIFVCNSMGGGGSSNNNGIAASTLEHYNNTVIMKAIGGQTEGADFGWYTIHGAGSALTGMRFSNNIIYLDPSLGIGPGIMRVPASDNSGTCVSLLSKLAGGNMDNNVWNRFTIANEPAGGFYPTLGSFQTASGKEANSIVAAPDLVNLAGNSVADFAPIVTSAAISRTAGHTFYGTSWGADFAQVA